MVGRIRTYFITFEWTQLRIVYRVMVRAQMLSELEEIIQFKQFADQPERQQSMRRTWMKRYDPFYLSPQLSWHDFYRLQGCQPEVEVWQRILQVRSLVSTPEDDPVMWIKFANLCRKSERMILADKTINSLLLSSSVRTYEFRLIIALTDFSWL